MSKLSMPMRSFATPFSFSTSTTLSAIRPAMYGTAPSAHCQVIAGRMRPSIQGRSISAQCKSDPAVSNRTGSPPVRHHRVTNVDVVFPVALIGSRRVADVRAREQHQRAEIVAWSSAARSFSRRSLRRRSKSTRYCQSAPVWLYRRRGSHSCGCPINLVSSRDPFDDTAACDPFFVVFVTCSVFAM